MEAAIDYSNFNMPADFQTTNKFKSVEKDVMGINRFDYGEDMVPWRFAKSARPWKKDKVKLYRHDGADTIPVIMFYRDKDNHIPVKLKHKVRYEPRETRQGEPFDKSIALTLEDLTTQGSPFYMEGASELDLWELPAGFDNELFQVAFEKWKETGAQKGTPLSAWRADPGMVQTLANIGIYSVEQFGDMSEPAVESEIIAKLPPTFHANVRELHEMAIIFVQSQTGLADVKALGDKLQIMQDANERLQEELDARGADNAELQRLLAKIKGVEDDGPAQAKKRSSRRKSQED